MIIYRIVRNNDVDQLALLLDRLGYKTTPADLRNGSTVFEKITEELFLLLSIKIEKL